MNTDLEQRMERYREATGDRDGLVLEALAAGYSKRDISKRTGISRATVINITRERDMDITDEQIRALSDEAGQAGDLEQVAICERALNGDGAARAECGRVIADAAAQS